MPTVEGMSASELEGNVGDCDGVSSSVCCAVDYFGPSDFLVMDEHSEREKGHKLVHDQPGELGLRSVVITNAACWSRFRWSNNLL